MDGRRLTKVISDLNGNVWGKPKRLFLDHKRQKVLEKGQVKGSLKRSHLRGIL
jgi:hypothetical protein